MRWARARTSPRSQPQSFAVAMCGRAHTSGSSPWRMSRRRTRLHSHLPVPHAGAATCKRRASARTPRRVFDRATPPRRVQSGNRCGATCRRRCLRAPTRTSSLWLQHRSASVDCAVSCPPFSNQALTFFFSDTNQAIIFKQRYAAEIEKLLRRLLEVRQLWLINHHRFLGCIALYLFGATHDDVTRPAKGFSGLCAGAAAVDMRTDLMRDGTRCYLGAVHGGTHIARPDRTVDSQGTGAKWRHATWLAFLVKLANLVFSLFREEIILSSPDIFTGCCVDRKLVHEAY